MLTTDEARARVAKGAAHLDSVRPGWFNRIDVGTLTLHDPCGCIVGQLCVSKPRHRADGTLAFSHEQLAEACLTCWSNSAYDDLVVGRGFDGDHDDDFPLLQDAWVEAIADRRLSETTTADASTDDKRGGSVTDQPVIALRA